MYALASGMGKMASAMMDHCHRDPRSDKSKTMRLSCSILVCLLLGTGWAYAQTDSEAKAAVAGPSTNPVSTDIGILQIKTTVEGLSVILDGKLIGQTPLPGPWAVTVGPHKLELKPADGASVFHSIHIQAERKTEIVYGLSSDKPASAAAEHRDFWPIAVPPLTMRRAGLATAGAGLALVVAGIVYGVQAQSTADLAGNLDRRTATRTRFNDLVERTTQSADMSNVLVSLGLAAILGGTGMNLFLEDGPFASDGGPEEQAKNDPSPATGELR